MTEIVEKLNYSIHVTKPGSDVSADVLQRKHRRRSPTSKAERRQIRTPDALHYNEPGSKTPIWRN